MTHFVIIAWDAPGSAAPRAAARDDHFAHIAQHIKNIAVAGPLKDPDGSNIGSLFVLNVDSAADAEALLQADPYFVTGVWDRWTIHPFLAAAGEWIGGTIW